jgi:hypothetical protein
VQNENITHSGTTSLSKNTLTTCDVRPNGLLKTKKNSKKRESYCWGVIANQRHKWHQGFNVAFN